MATGHIEKRERNKYRIVIDYGKQNGKRIRRTVTFNGLERDAKKELARLLGNAEYIEPTKMTVEKYLDWWLEQREKTNQDLSPATLESYKNIKNAYIVPHIGSIRVQNLRPFHIQSYVNDLLDKKSPRTADYALVILKMALDDAVEPWEIIRSNPAKSIKRPTYKKNKYHVFTKKELQRVLDVAGYGTMDYYLILVALFTGMRRGELCGLQWDCVDLENNIIHVARNMIKTKGGVEIKEPKTQAGFRTISIPPTLNSIFQKIKIEQEKNREYFTDKGTNFVFHHADGRPYLPDYVTHKFRKIADTAELSNARFHDLRHTHATLLFAWGERLHDVQSRMGHEKPSTTIDLYGHSMKERAKDVAARFEKNFMEYLGDN